MPQQPQQPQQGMQEPPGESSTDAAPAVGLTPAQVEAVVAGNYDLLRAMVRACVVRYAGERGGGLTNSPTGMAHDVWMQVLGQRQPFRDAEHVMAVAAVLSERVVVDALRARSRSKRGGGDRGGPLPNGLAGKEPEPASWLERDGVADALSRFARELPRAWQVLALRVCYGRSVPEVARIVGVSTATVERDLRAAEVYLRGIMEE